MRWCWIMLGALVLALVAPVGALAAHPTVSTVAIVKVYPDGRVVITLVHDTLAFALNGTSGDVADAQMYALLDGPRGELGAALTAARERFAALFRLSVDGKVTAFEVIEAPTLEAVVAWRGEHPGKVLPKMDFVVGAALPAGAESFSVRFPEVLGEVILTVDRPGVEPISVPLRAGEESPRTVLFPKSESEARAGAAGTLAVVLRYVGLGFTHIVPLGFDHVLFVLGLFLLSGRMSTLLWQVTAFTVAHSITLSLTMLDVVALPPAVTEPIIAASIAFVAIENLATSKVHAWRVALVFVFGLIHGMGFATALREAGIPKGQLAAALVSFNVGVELGQLAVIGTALLTVGWWRKKEWYRRRVTVPASVVIAGVALFWTVQRVM